MDGRIDGTGTISSMSLAVVGISWELCFGNSLWQRRVQRRRRRRRGRRGTRKPISISQIHDIPCTPCDGKHVNGN